VLELQLPWRILSQKLVKINESGMVLYMSTFESSQLQLTKVKGNFFAFVRFKQSLNFEILSIYLKGG